MKKKNLQQLHLFLLEIYEEKKERKLDTNKVRSLIYSVEQALDSSYKIKDFQNVLKILVAEAIKFIIEYLKGD